MDEPTTTPSEGASPNSVWPPVAVPGQGRGLHTDQWAEGGDRSAGDMGARTGPRIPETADHQRTERGPLADGPEIPDADGLSGTEVPGPGAVFGPQEPDGPADRSVGGSEGPVLLDELRSVIARYVILPSPEALDAVTLWVAATHLQPAFQHAPRLAVVGPAKWCGKSRLLDVVTETVHKPVITVNASTAAIFRSVTQEPPTLLVDEADTLFGSPKVAEKNEDLRGLLNAGHQRNRPALRIAGPEHKPVEGLRVFRTGG